MAENNNRDFITIGGICLITVLLSIILSIIIAKAVVREQERINNENVVKFSQIEEKINILAEKYDNLDITTFQVIVSPKENNIKKDTIKIKNKRL